MGTSWKFVGRTVETASLRDVARGSTGRGLLFGGAAGIGKTRLLREGIAAIDGPGSPLIMIPASTTTANLPLGSLSFALPVEQPPGLTPAGLLAWAMEALRRQASHGPLVFAIDDVHLLDPLSAMVIYSLARNDRAIVIATRCTGENVPDPIRALWAEDLLDRCELGPLDETEVADLLPEMFEMPFEATSTAALWHLTQGNPLFLREAVLAAHAAGDLVESFGMMRWTGRLALSANLIELIDSRLGDLDPKLLEVVEIVAFAEPIGLTLLNRACSPAAVEIAEERQLIRIVTDQRRTCAQLGHPLYGEIVRQRCPQSRARRVLAELATLVEGTGARRRNDAIQVAVWRLESGTATDPAAMLAVCRRACSAYDMPLAIRLGQAAIDLGAGVDAAETLATAMIFADRPLTGLEILDWAEPRIANDHERSRWTVARGVITFYGLADLRTADRMRAAARRLSGTDERHWVHAIEGAMRMHATHYADGERLSNEVLRGGGPVSATAVAHTNLAVLAAARGLPLTALKAIGQAEATSSVWRADSPYIQLAAEFARGTALILSGDLAAVDEMISNEFADLAEAGNLRLGSGYLTVVRAQAARLRGQLSHASRLARQACAQLASGEVFATLAYAEKAHIAALMGNAAEATAAMAESDRRHSGNMEILYPWRELARAWVTVATGDVDGGREVLLRLVARLAEDGLRGFEVLALHDLIRLGFSHDRGDRIYELIDGMEGAFGPVIAMHSLAARHQNGADLTGVARQFGRMGMHLYEAECLAEALRTFRHDRSPELQEAARRLAETRQHCPDGHTPALAMSWPVLTARQLEIARRAAAGMRSKQIADEFFLSARTVDNHLRRIYARLGVSGRAELAGELMNLPHGAN